MFANLKLRRFQALENREFPVPEKHTSRTSSNSTFRGWRVFLNSPTTCSYSFFRGFHVALLVWLASHQPTIPFTHTKSALAIKLSMMFLSQQISTSR
jgi:hypothetical protein